MRPCKSCRASIHMLRTPEGKWMPVDADTHPQGNLLIDLRENTVQVLTDPELGIARLDGAQLHMSHFATCPYAGKHRRRR